MGNVKFSDLEKNDIDILRCLLQLYILWQDELRYKNDNRKNKLLQECLTTIEIIIENSDLTPEEINIINDTLINKKCSMEKIGRKYFYSDSGIRNRVNLILKKILEQTKENK